MKGIITKKNFSLFLLTLCVGVVLGVLVVSKLDFMPVVEADEKKGYSKAPYKTDASGLQQAFIDVAKDVGPAVVSISTVRKQRIGTSRQFFFGRPFEESPFGDEFFDRFFRDFFEGMPEQREYEQRGLGSGVIIDERGFILTNEHVVSRADEITVTLPDGRKFEGVIKGKDPRSDLAVIKIDAKNLPVAQLGNSDNVKIGQWAIAIGNPFAYMVGSSEPTVTVGVVSALNRAFGTGRSERDYAGLIQTDAAINPGNSGGPLVGLDGEIIGINVAIFSTSGGYQGVGFAIPINRAKEILDDLIEGKKVLYGWLGVQVQDINDELAEYFNLKTTEGILIAKVLPDSPAEKGGMKAGDVIKEFDGQKIKDVKNLLKIVGRTKVGKKVKANLIRDGKSVTLKIKIGKRPDQEDELKETEPKSWKGIEVSDITEELAKKYRIEYRKGVLVTNIERDSPAFKSGIRTRDIIEEINRCKIESVADFNKVTSRIKGDCLVRTPRGYTIIKAE